MHNIATVHVGVSLVTPSPSPHTHSCDFCDFFGSQNRISNKEENKGDILRMLIELV